MESYDVLVVGAGPAGGTAAWFMAKKGLKVLLVEKKKAIGVPVTCGEALNWKTTDIIEIPDQVIDHQLSKQVLYKDHVRIRESGFSAFMINRGELDRYLALKAVSAGAELSISTRFIRYEKENEKEKKVSVLLKQGEKIRKIFCSILVGADGFGSKVAKLAGFTGKLTPEDYSVTYQYYMSNVDTDENAADFFMFVPYIAGGYAWIFPKRFGTANVGLGMHPHQGANARDILNTFIHQNEVAHKKCQHAFPLSQSASVLYSGGPLENIVTDHILVIGEAAGHVHPVTGEGNYFAIMGGKMVSEMCAASIKEDTFSKEFLKKFENECNKAFAENLRSVLTKNYVNSSLSTQSFDHKFQY